MDLVVIAAPVALFHHIARVREVGQDAVDRAFGDAERPWTQAETSRARIVGHQLGAVIDALAEPPELVALPGGA